jgi:putative transposase
VVRQEFLVEIGDGHGVTGLAELNKLFTAWYETVYHTRPHSETGQPPIQRWLAGAPFPAPSPEQLREAFLRAEHRMVRKDATIKLFGGAYETDPALAGRRVECVFDPFDLSAVEVRWNGKPWGLARPQHIGPAFPPQGQAGGPGRAAARDRDRLPGHHRRRARTGRPPPPHPLRRPRG